jgi:RNA polymerase sigma-70 factor (ECF subfamily)
LSAESPTARPELGGRPHRHHGGSRTLAPEALAQHLDRLYRAAWALCGSREDAEDLVQETCARVLQKPRRLRSGDDYGYLLRALRNTYFSTRRSAGRRPRVTTTLEDIDVADPNADAQPERALAAREVYAAIGQLPEPFRLAVVAVDVLGLSHRDASRALRVREATVTTRLFRGRQRVARELDAHGNRVATSRSG